MYIYLYFEKLFDTFLQERLAYLNGGKNRLSYLAMKTISKGIRFIENGCDVIRLCIDQQQKLQECEKNRKSKSRKSFSRFHGNRRCYTVWKIDALRGDFHGSNIIKIY
jgi:hypothetical protein